MAGPSGKRKSAPSERRMNAEREKTMKYAQTERAPDAKPKAQKKVRVTVSKKSY